MNSKTLRAVILSSMLTSSLSSLAVEDQKSTTNKTCQEILSTQICEATENCQEVTMEDVLEELAKNGCVEIENKPGSNSTTCITIVCGTR